MLSLVPWRFVISRFSTFSKHVLSINEGLTWNQQPDGLLGIFKNSKCRKENESLRLYEVTSDSFNESDLDRPQSVWTNGWRSHQLCGFVGLVLTIKRFKKRTRHQHFWKSLRIRGILGRFWRIDPLYINTSIFFVSVHDSPGSISPSF